MNDTDEERENLYSHQMRLDKGGIEKPMDLSTSFRGGRVPSLGIVGAALWIAWITIIYSADLALGESGVSQQSTSSAFVYSTCTLGVSLIALSFVPNWTRRHLLGPTPLALSSCIAAAATLIVLNGASVSFGVFAICSAITGCTTALVALRLAVVFSEVESRSMLMGMGCALVLGVLVYAFAMMLVLCHLVIPAAVMLVVLIPLAVFCLNLEEAENSILEVTSPIEESRLKPSAMLVRLAVFAAMSLFLLSLTRGYYPSLIEPSAFTVSRCVVAIGLILVALMIMVAAWVSPRDAAFGTLCYTLLVACVLAVLVMALLKVNATVLGDGSSILFGVTCICLWALLCRMSFRSGVDAVRIVGLGFGASCLGTTTGVAVGAAIYNMGMPEGLLSFVMAIAIILCVAASLLLLRRGDIVRLMEPAPSAVSVEREMLNSVESAASVSVENTTSSDASILDDYQASLQRLCVLVGIDCALSSREVDVLELLIVGKDAKAIADELYISFNTVRSHIRRIYVKLGVHNRRELLDRVKNQAI